METSDSSVSRGGVVEVKNDEDIDKFTTAGVLDMLGNTYKTKPTACFYQNPIFSDLDVGLEPLASDDDARLLFNILVEVNGPCKQVHLYFEHNVVDVPEEISLDEEEDDDQRKKDDQGQEDDQEEECDQEKEGDQEDDTIEDSSYKLGPGDNNSEEFDDGRVDSGGGEGV
ncbi:histone chaperone ASF1-like [Punica granatum]|uniref:Histone chaperone ASF1-like n=1 Tax=Punica granatum TaxID=22663 RepID=A0A6P8D6F8_PUNGR|nr:histone chaperone ASF1-like [Punica granatum]